MKTNPVILFAPLFLFGCRGYENSKSAYTQDSASADSAHSTVDTLLSSSAAVQNSHDSIHQFVRTADLKFKVNNVGQTTAVVEDIANRQGGFVTYTHLASDIDHVSTIPVSPDSSLETTYFTVTNSMVLRVPNTKLDTTLKEIARTVDYLDYRIIKADDVALQLLSNELTEQRAGQHQNRLIKAIDNRSSKLKETVEAEEAVSDKQLQAHQSLLSSRLLMDQIKFSTVNLNLYQGQALRRELVFNNRDIPAYEPSFGSRLLGSFMAGWRMLQTFLVFVAGLWWLILSVLVVYYFFYKPLRRTPRKKLAES